VKLRWLLLAATLAFASGGALLWYESERPIVSEAPIASGMPRHLIDEGMRRAADSLHEKKAPEFRLADSEGKPWFIGNPRGSRPQFVYFIMDGCPCSAEVEPLFNDLQASYGHRVDFLGVIDKDAKIAARWKNDMRVPNPVIPSPDTAVMKGFKATNSAFSALVRKDGTIVKMWPGYSVSILGEINDLLAREAGVDPKPFDPKYAPKLPAAGCNFYEEL